MSSLRSCPNPNLFGGSCRSGRTRTSGTLCSLLPNRSNKTESGSVRFRNSEGIDLRTAVTNRWTLTVPRHEVEFCCRCAWFAGNERRLKDGQPIAIVSVRSESSGLTFQPFRSYATPLSERTSQLATAFLPWTDTTFERWAASSRLPVFDVSETQNKIKVTPGGPTTAAREPVRVVGVLRPESCGADWIRAQPVAVVHPRFVDRVCHVA